MKKIDAKLIIFDLDGTLIDSKEDIATALNQTLKAVSIPELPLSVIYSHVGNGVRELLKDSVREADNGVDFSEAVKHFRKIYPKRLLDTTVMFDGVKEQLDHFFSKNKVMAVASNKPAEYVNPVIDGLGMRKYFAEVFGGNSLKTKKPEPEMINTILKNTGIIKEDAVFIGDSAVDIEAGKNSSIKTIGCTYGFRSKEEIIKSMPDIVIEHPKQMSEVIV